MAQLIYASTASFCVENARELGIPAALLLDKIVRLSKATTREDGYCWYTARQFEEETSLKKDAFDRAAKKLETEGIIARKVTYIVGTMTKATHFKLKPLKSQNQKTESGSDPQSRNPLKTTFCEYNKNTINSADFGFSGFDAPQASPAPLASSENENPFGAPTKQAESVRPDLMQDPAHQKRRQAFAVLSEIYAEFGLRGKPTAREASLVSTALSFGFTKESLKEAMRWCERHEFWHDKPVISWLSESALKQFDAVKRGQMRPDAPSPWLTPDRLDPDFQESEGYKKAIEFLDNQMREIIEERDRENEQKSAGN